MVALDMLRPTSKTGQAHWNRQSTAVHVTIGGGYKRPVAKKRQLTGMR